MTDGVDEGGTTREDLSSAERRAAEARAAPAVAQVREEDLEPHEGLRYIARLFKGVAVLILFLLVAEIVIGLRQDGTAAIGLLLVQATRLIVFACLLWGAGDIALMLIESNHDLRATRILLGRIHTRLEQRGADTGGDGRDADAQEPVTHIAAPGSPSAPPPPLGQRAPSRSGTD